MIDDIIAAGAAATGLNESQVRRALAGALGLLERHADGEKLAALHAAVPGAEALARSPDGRIPPAKGLFGGLMKSAGGVSGAAVADAMAMMDQAAKAGVDRPHLKALLKAAEARIAEDSGKDVLREALRSIPGVGALLSK
jgi:hypothetical protein